MEPQEITQAEAADLLASGFETGRYEPLGLFLVGEARRPPGPGLTTAPAMPGRKSLEPRPSAWKAERRE